MSHQPQLIPNQPSPDQAARDAERTEYLERLREKLQDPEFRAIEGFPIGEDEDILALSDPPYYTACPNPFLPEIIHNWRQERTELREELGLPDDSHDDGNGGQPVYHREPFAADVSEGRSGSIYNAHSYHTKVPHKAIMRYILHYTDPGDIVFDGFCGTGMTGVAAQLCADRKVARTLNYQVKKDGTVLDGRGQAISHLGTRKAVLIDLSPAAMFIAYNYNTPVDVNAFQREAKRILSEVEDECGWVYETVHTDGKTKGKINYIIWSDVFVCPECGSEMVFWDVAVDKDAGKVQSSFSCSSCSAEQNKRTLDHAWETIYDRSMDRTMQRAKQVPVLINYSIGKSRHEKSPDDQDVALIHRIEASDIPFQYPTEKMMFTDGVWGDQWRDGYHRDITNVHHFYTHRNLMVLAALRHAIASIDDPILRAHLLFMVSSYDSTHSTKMTRIIFKSGGKKPVLTGYQSGTLYISSLPVEKNILNGIRNMKVRSLASAFGQIRYSSGLLATHSATDLNGFPDSSVDYIFVDPPFGDNLMYSELNFLWESWLRVFTNNTPEAIVTKTRHKTLLDYQRLMQHCFGWMYRVLKPGRWMTVEFHNSRNAVWNAIQEAILHAGFVVADVRILDKQQGSFNAANAPSAVKRDLVISAYKPRTGFERRFLKQAGSKEGAWDFVRQHLQQLPVVVERPAPAGGAGDSTLEVVAEREAYLLYDRMLAFHIQRGFSVPLGAAEFYAGLRQRFPERDGMYFLSHQAVEYDRHRLRAVKVEQLALFVTDERSALQWLRRELDSATGSGPQTYQDLQPKFLRELHQARHEDLPELGEMLAQSFLKDERDRWYVPDPARQEDLEKLRERSLLREYSEYAEGKGRLRTFRTEAVRAGFKRAWAERDYRTIVRVAERLPPSVLQEDAGLLMYYDNALMRVEEEPEQGRWM